MLDRRRICSAIACGLWISGGAGVLAQTAPSRDWSQTPEQWQRRCREIIARLIRYPGRPQAGEIELPADSRALVKVDRDGKILDVEVLKSSGVPELDRAVVDAAWRAGRLPEPSLISAAQYPTALIPIAFPER